jgi:hypothetical protein
MSLKYLVPDQSGSSRVEMIVETSLPRVTPAASVRPPESSIKRTIMERNLKILEFMSFIPPGE